jgi:YD repeat-containing protein
VRVIRATKDCLPTHIIETTLDSPDDRTTYLEYNHKDGEPAELTTLRMLVMDSGTDDETTYYFKYESEVNFLGFNPPRLTEIRFGPSEQTDPQNQMMMCFYYVPLAEWGDASGWILRFVQGPFRRGEFATCDFHTLMDAQMGPLTEYSFDKVGRLREVEYPGRYLYSIHYRDQEVQISRAWHLSPDDHQDCCHGVLRPDGDGTKCDPRGPDQPDAFDNPLFCPLHELTVLRLTMENTGFEAQVARIEDNYGRWTAYERDDPWGHPTRITNHDGQTWDLRYDSTMAGRHLPVEVIDPYGRRTRTEYNDFGHVIVDEPGDGTEVRTQYYLDGPGDPTWAFGTPRKITRRGDPGWREGLDSDDVLEETSFVARQDGGHLVVEQFISGRADPVFTEKLNQAGHVIERTSHQLGLSSVFERSGNNQTIKWREEAGGKEGMVNSFRFSGAGKLTDIQGPFFSASIGYTPDGRIESYNASDQVLKANFHRWGMIESVEAGTRASVHGARDPSDQDRAEQIGEFDCNGLPVQFGSARSGSRGGSGWGMTYESPRDCRVTEATEEESGICTVPQEERDECGYGQNLHNIGYKDGFCEKINNNVSAMVCDCIRRCECDASSYDIYTGRYTICYPARIGGERECLEDNFYDICN